ncbi:hypothetical protein NLJ89_g8532 [Agrocybe chaxingu]|uniref:Manganese lipoxygenase n=1 Tax=Agrocybe chaxingu TaxID=84603 RepID=A0A9W8K1M5_9AGAR|nr:hypothetical protein NLJ89_g8532 [Agrocybe chaxingu]
MARMILVPVVIAALAPFKLPEIKALCNYTYHSFDFTGHYIPEDLKKRGFDVAHFDNPFGQFHNYAYARDMAKMWDVLHKFVGSTLSAHYKGSDAEVRADKYVADFCAEMQSTVGGQMPQFPTVKTLADLVDVVTMCIHIASPQHTSINYLQQYYLTYVPNRPSALFAPLPTSLKELAAYKEADVLKALPLQSRNTWLMMAQVPYLLSAEVEPENNIVSYAKNAAKSWNSAINQAAKVLQEDVKGLEASFKAISAQMDDQGTEYAVLDPNIMATSILI